MYGDGRLYLSEDEPGQQCINATTGALIWDVPTTGTTHYSAAYVNGTLYRGDLDNTFTALNGATGQTIWSYDPNDYGYWCSGVAAGYGMVYELNVDGYIYALNATTGAVVWKYMGLGQVYPGYVQIADGMV